MKFHIKPTATRRTLFFIGTDMILSLVSLYSAYLLRFNFHMETQFLQTFWVVYGVLVSLKVAGMFLFKSYFSVWRFFSFSDAQNIIKAHLFSYGAFVLLYFLLPSLFVPFPRSVIIIDFFLSLILIGMLRAAKRFWNEAMQDRTLKPTLLLGANSKAATIIQSALKHEIDYYPVAIVAVDNKETLSDSYIHNVKVYALEKLTDVIRKKRVEAAIITHPMSQKELKEVVSHLNDLGVSEIKRVKLLGSEHERLENLSIEDLLARHPQDLDTSTIAAFIKDKTILVTGAGGSIGSEIARQCRHFGAAALTLVDNCEYNLYRIGEEIGDADMRLLDVTDLKAVDKLMRELAPQIVIHAAAYKHVPICEHNPDAAVHNNIIGTKNVIDCAIVSCAEKVVIISTDKAVRPTNVMGATKRVTELYAQNVPSGNTDIAVVRFGNVLGSSGSVIPKFKHQIEEGGPVTVTHSEITRYFMLIPEACQLVLQAAAIAKGRELFILDMGDPVKIDDLAKQMIRLYGKEGEIEIVYTGLRPGEKLYEEILISESEQKTQYSSIVIAHPTEYDIEMLRHDIDVLVVAEEKIKQLQKIVPEFEHR